MKTTFLLEIAVEEIPASYIEPAIQFLQQKIDQLLQNHGIAHEAIMGGATPRRLVIFCPNLETDSEKIAEEIKGPPVSIAYDEQMQPTAILNKFLSSNNLKATDVFQKQLAKGLYVFGQIQRYYGTTANILQAELPPLLANIPFAKKMRWLSANNFCFARPIRNILLLLGSKQLSINIAVPQQATSQARFYLIENDATIKSYADYFNHLQKQGIKIDYKFRKEEIASQLQAIAASKNAKPGLDNLLLDTVTHINETPFVAIGRFEEEFLAVPECVLVSVMRDHQKYFPLYDQSGKICNSFLFIANQSATDEIIKGNERVLRARFKDAQFFYKEDLKTPLQSLTPRLTEIMFTKETGNFWHKVQRILSYIEILDSGYLPLCNHDKIQLKQTISLAKTDQLSALVFEFPDLEGEIGCIIAKAQGIDEAIATAIYEQYLPRGPHSSLPKTRLGALHSFLEKIDNLMVLFASGKIPSGSADPYALRRQANGLIEILLEQQWSVDLSQLIHELFLNLRQKNREEHGLLLNEGLRPEQSLLDFIRGRAKTILSNRSFAHDEIEALFAGQSFDIFYGFSKLTALQHQRQKLEFKDLVSGYKRIANILSSAKKKKETISPEIQADLLQETAEIDLYQALLHTKKANTVQYQEKNYHAIVQNFIAMRPSIDNFFDAIMVLCKDARIRSNRLALLQQIANLFLQFLDFSKLQDSGGK